MHAEVRKPGTAGTPKKIAMGRGVEVPRCR